MQVAPVLPDRPTSRWLILDGKGRVLLFRFVYADGPIAGQVLEADKYDTLLQHYYDQRGYDRRGIPTKATLAKLGLTKEAESVEKFARLTP